jgi:hypothetical protein
MLRARIYAEIEHLYSHAGFAVHLQYRESEQIPVRQCHIVQNENCSIQNNAVLYIAHELARQPAGPPANLLARSPHNNFLSPIPPSPSFLRTLPRCPFSHLHRRRARRRQRPWQRDRTRPPLSDVRSNHNRSRRLSRAGFLQRTRLYPLARSTTTRQFQPSRTKLKSQTHLDSCSKCLVTVNVLVNRLVALTVALGILLVHVLSPSTSVSRLNVLLRLTIVVVLLM